MTRPPLLVFGYGSLMYEPACPDRLDDLLDATLPGHRRSFNKRSIVRGCPDDEALLPEPLPTWRIPGHRVSLCLGTAPAPDARMEGKVLVYPPSARDEVLHTLDRREGVVADRPPDHNGYDRVLVPVHTPAGPAHAITYLTRPGSVLHVPHLDLPARAEVIARATPRTRGSKARGAEYLADAIAVLQRVGVRDEGLARLGREVVAVLQREGVVREDLTVLAG